MGNKKKIPISYVVRVDNGTEQFTIERYVSQNEYDSNDVSYQAALLAKNGFHYVYEDGTNIWIPPHRIVEISWNMVEFKH